VYFHSVMPSIRGITDGVWAVMIYVFNLSGSYYVFQLWTGTSYASRAYRLSTRWTFPTRPDTSNPTAVLTAVCQTSSILNVHLRDIRSFQHWRAYVQYGWCRLVRCSFYIPISQTLVDPYISRRKGTSTSTEDPPILQMGRLAPHPRI